MRYLGFMRQGKTVEAQAVMDAVTQRAEGYVGGAFSKRKNVYMLKWFNDCLKSAEKKSPVLPLTSA